MPCEARPLVFGVLVRGEAMAARRVGLGLCIAGGRRARTRPATNEDAVP